MLIDIYEYLFLLLTAAVTISLVRYSLTDDLANLVPLHVPPTQAIPTTPP